MRRVAVLFAALVATVAGGAWAADVPPAVTPPPSPLASPEAAKKAVEQHVEAKTREGHGAYRLEDDQTGEVLELVYEDTAIVAAGGVWSVHDGARTAARSDFYACSTFHPAHGSADRRYDLDFRVEPRATGYVVREVVIHRDGKRVGGSWVWTARPAPKPHELDTGAGTGAAP
jgi:hypothetical protein